MVDDMSHSAQYCGSIVSESVGVLLRDETSTLTRDLLMVKPGTVIVVHNRDTESEGKTS
jgi:hypothetical protein